MNGHDQSYNCECVIRANQLKEAEKLGKFGYFHYDIHTKKITWSEGMFNIFARDPASGEPTVEEFFELYAIDPGIDKMRELAGKQETIEFDACATRADDLLYIHLAIQTLKDDKGNAQARFGTVQDITERKRAEQKVCESESFKQAILDSLPAHIAVLDQQGIVLAVNRSWIRFAEENGLSDVQSVCVGADYLAVCRKAADMTDPLALEALSGIEDVLKGKPEFSLNYPCHAPTQQRWFIMNVIRPCHDIQGAVVTHLDITDRVKAENDIQEANRELEAFNHTVAHDLRKPLTVINGYAQAMMGICMDQPDAKCETYPKEIYEGTLRMNRLIDALLNFSRVAHAELKREHLNLCEICREVASELKLADLERHVIFRIPGVIEAEADPDLLRVVMSNLLGNSWKYTSTREEGIIEFGATIINEEPAYFVSDNGLGFHPEEAKKMFAPFERLDSGKDTVAGLGIGLATVDRIIRRHGGRVWAAGEPQKGATFYFTLG